MASTDRWTDSAKDLVHSDNSGCACRIRHALKRLGIMFCCKPFLQRSLYYISTSVQNSAVSTPSISDRWPPRLSSITVREFDCRYDHLADSLFGHFNSSHKELEG